MNQKYIGLDLSLQATGVCSIYSDYSVVKNELIAPKSTDTCTRLYLNRNELSQFLKDEQKDNTIKLCCIEGPSFGSKDGGRLFQIGEWTGVAKLLLFELGIPFVLAVPSQLKKYISGTGKDVKKEHIMLDVYKKYNIEFRDNNLADAYVLSRIARDFDVLRTTNAIPTSIFKYQEEVIKAMYKTYENVTQTSLI